jgi:hypothetical protein
MSMDKYAVAQERIAVGLWRVKPEEGYVSNSAGRRLGSLTSSGYVYLALAPLQVGGTKQNVFAHRVIWESVHGPIPPGLQINHKNGRKTDNRLSNLELVTCSENQHHRYATGLYVSPKGERSSVAKLTADQVVAIRSRYAAGALQRELAAEYGLHRAYVSLLIRGLRWPDKAMPGGEGRDPFALRTRQ